MPHSNLAVVSDHLFAVTVIVYCIAMLAYAADLAFSRRGAVSSRDRRTSQAPARQLVGAGAPVPPANDQGDGTAAVQADAAPARPTTGDERDERPGRFGKIALAITAIGWLVHLAEVLTRGFATKRVPWGNMYEFSSAVALVAVGGFLVLAFRQRARFLGLFVLVPVVVYLALAGTVLYAKAGPVLPVLKSYWLWIHVTAAIIATGTFMVGGVVSVLQLGRRRYDALTAVGKQPRLTKMAERLPAAQVLERVEYRIIAFAFPIWTFAIIAGAVWAESAWGRYWGWDPKETWSFITWVIYAGYLHARSTAGLRRYSARIALFAFCALITNYYLVNLFITGRHAYSGV